MFPAALHAAVKRLAREGLARTAPSNDGRAAVVLDTHVWMECLHWRDPKAAPLARALREGDLVAALSEDSLMELAGVLSRPTFGAQEGDVLAVLERATAGARWCTPEALAAAAGELEARCVRCRDPEDQKFLALTRAAGAAILFTRDRLLTKAAKKLRESGVKVLVPEAWPPKPEEK